MQVWPNCHCHFNGVLVICPTLLLYTCAQLLQVTARAHRPVAPHAEIMFD